MFHRSRAQLLTGAIAATLVVGTALALLGAPLQTDAAPSGILSYEFAGGAAKARAILDSWDEEARLYAAFQLGLDYLFLLLYPLAIALACLMMADSIRDRLPRLAALGVALAWSQPVAGLLDAAENFALVSMLLDAPGEGLARMALLCAVPKFAIVVAGILYVPLGAVARALSKGS
jgi:hypothetical protein